MTASFLETLFATPAAPYRETHVLRLLEQTARDSKIPCFRDPYGNLILGAASKTEYLKKCAQAKRASRPLCAYIAHTDHPGFHLTKKIGNRSYAYEWLGGAPVAHLEGARVWIANDEKRLGGARITKAELTQSGRSIARGELELETECADLNDFDSNARSHFGGFRFKAPVWKEGSRYYTSAADDLAGCYALVKTAQALYPKGRPTSAARYFLGILTRAEEVGFIGCIAHLELGWLKPHPQVLVVSLESSRTLPGAEIGKGPVLRLGDRMSVFSANALQSFLQIAQAGDAQGAIPFQRRIMDGGSCEASAARGYGFETIGLSVPLGNYHNQSLEGGPDAGPAGGVAPEFIDESDLKGMQRLCLALVTTKDRVAQWKSPWKTTRDDFKKSLSKSRALLSRKPLVRGTRS